MTTLITQINLLVEKCNVGGVWKGIGHGTADYDGHGEAVGQHLNLESGESVPESVCDAVLANVPVLDWGCDGGLFQHQDGDAVYRFHWQR